MEKKLVLHTILFICLTAVLYILLVCASAIPNEKISDNMTKSAYAYKDTDAFSYEHGERLCAVADNYADSILLNVSYNMGRGNPFITSLDTAYYSGGELGVNAGLFLSVSENIPPDTDYTRYWHGSGGILRIMHLFFSVDTIKITGLIFILIFSAITLILLIRRKNYITAVSLFIGLLAVHIWNTALSLEYQSVFILCFMLCPIYLWAERKNEHLLTYISVVGGTLTAFFDFLTCETAVILLPLILIISVRLEGGRLGEVKKELFLILKCLACFFLSYGGMFLMKWLLSSLVTGSNKLALAVSQAEIRVAGGSDEMPDSLFLRIPSAVTANLTVLFGGSARVELKRVILCLSALCAVFGSLYYLFGKRKRGAWLMLALGTVVLARYMVLSNHSYLHGFFTYRALIVPVTAVISAFLLSIPPAKMKGWVKQNE